MIDTIMDKAVSVMDEAIAVAVYFILFAIVIRGVPLLFEGLPQWYLLLMYAACGLIIGASAPRITRWLTN